MLKRKFVKMEEANAGEGGSAGGGTTPDVAKMQQELDAMRKSQATLLDEKKKLQKQYEGIDVEAVRKMQAHFDSSEEAKLIAENKWDEVINRRYAKKDAENQRQIEEAKAEVAKAKEHATRFYSKMMAGEIAANLPKDFDPNSLKLALKLAEDVFNLNEEGELIPKDGRYGKNGKDLYNAKEWGEDLREQFPNLFVNQNSGSSHFNKGSKEGGSKTISREKWMALSPMEQQATYKAGITVVDR